MNKKGGNVIRIVLGVYLIYLGVSIFIEVVQKNPANSGFMGAAGGIFVIVGAVYAFLAAKKVFAEMKKEKNVEEELSVSEADGNEIKWQEAEISHAYPHFISPCPFLPDFLLYRLLPRSPPFLYLPFFQPSLFPYLPFPYLLFFLRCSPCSLFLPLFFHSCPVLPLP